MYITQTELRHWMQWFVKDSKDAFRHVPHAVYSELLRLGFITLNNEVLPAGEAYAHS